MCYWVDARSSLDKKHDWCSGYHRGLSPSTVETFFMFALNSHLIVRIKEIHEGKLNAPIPSAVHSIQSIRVKVVLLSLKVE